MDNCRKPIILVSGATGYVGGRLVPILLERNYKVRCLVRDPSIIEGRGWSNIEIVAGDVLKYGTLLLAMKDVSVAYYLVHSMAGGEGFQKRDLTSARNFGKAAREAGVKRIIYLGGLGENNEQLSEHLKSRQQTGNCLREWGIPVTEFRAAQIIGSGSASFELIRNTVERVPVLVTSKLIGTRAQPIAIRDVLSYLADCLEIPETESAIIEIGGSEILTYREMMLKYAEIRGIKRKVLEVPFMSTNISAFLVDLVTPIPANIARPLIEGLKNEVVVKDDSAKRLFDIAPISYEQAVRFALERIGKGQVLTTWQDAYSSFGGKVSEWVKLTNIEGMIKETRQIKVFSDITTAFKVITCGNEGWLFANYLWHVRGFIDRISGGVGLKRARRCPTNLRVGDTLGFWRVEDLKTNCLLRLRSEMRMVSRAWLQFEIKELEDKKLLITQTAFFEPKGLTGLMYWYFLYPMHKVVLKGMLNALAEQILQSNTGKEIKNHMSCKLPGDMDE
ncbi:MAG: hypothetical protein APF84_07540 [Gracilibacter sp. BRH_c7a]|nr:MAG: hypothetical protein APF84_07540 [Gracilibacter sp. BRH_c7a]